MNVLDLTDDHPTRLPVPWTIDVGGKHVTTQGARHACRILSGIPDLEYVDGRIGSRSKKRTLRIVAWAKDEDEAWLWYAYEELRCQSIIETFSVSVGDEVEAQHRAWWLEMVKADDQRLSIVAPRLTQM